MTYKERVLRGDASSEHIVQLFDTDQSRANTIGGYIAESLNAGDSVLVAATPAHWKSMAERAGQLGCQVREALQSGQLTFVSAATVLQEMLLEGVPDPALFYSVIGETVRSLAARGKPIRIYGEIVDLLAAERNFSGALRLEDCWDALGKQFTFTLFCGYSSAHFAAQQSATALELVARCHSEVRASQVDELASWLLESNGLKKPASSL